MEKDDTLANPAVRIGQRIYSGLEWRRRDDILLNGQRIGVITQTSQDRLGTTVCTVTGHSCRGRAISWCVDQVASAATDARTESHHAA